MALAIPRPLRHIYMDSMYTSTSLAPTNVKYSIMGHSKDLTVKEQGKIAVAIAGRLEQLYNIAFYTSQPYSSKKLPT